jgi:hypothetical protein
MYSLVDLARTFMAIAGGKATYDPDGAVMALTEASRKQQLSSGELKQHHITEYWIGAVVEGKYSNCEFRRKPSVQMNSQLTVPKNTTAICPGWRDFQPRLNSWRTRPIDRSGCKTRKVISIWHTLSGAPASTSFTTCT